MREMSHDFEQRKSRINQAWQQECEGGVRLRRW
jgi:hypothetical protein